MAHDTDHNPIRTILAEDLNKVHEAENGLDSLLKMQGMISTGITPEDIESWYLSHDPIGEVAARHFDRSRHGYDTKGLNDERYLYAPMVYASGAVILATSIIFPELFKDQESAQNWPNSLDPLFIEWAEKSGIEIDKPENKIHDIEAMALVLDALPDVNLSNDQVRRLAIATDMFSLAYAGILDVAQSGFVYPGSNLDSMRTTALMWRGCSNELSIILARKTLANKSDELSFDDSLRYGLKHMWTHNLRTASEIQEMHGAEENISVIALTMIRVIQDVFVDGRALERADNRGEWKGTLHELIWPLDAYMLKLAWPEKYDGISVTPASIYQDEPRNGYPTLRRGFDYTVRTPYSATAIQLKSNDTPTKDYNPKIKVLKEKNFQDASIPRLRAKMVAYRKAVEANPFDRAFIQQVTDKFVLGTVRQEMGENADVISGERDRRVEVARDLRKLALNPYGYLRDRGHQIPNRTQRRALEKQARKRPRT
ncbi:MAG TPA: hypothetical protein PLZ58_01315 [Candidatus Saccharibacteria bacterium]|nr:hypothetical protein [Candidatus Saccharibacteria bacterium]HRQ07042.1 hypothetical protein [Candidatus Saccharibacteria bacterium]